MQYRLLFLSILLIAQMGLAYLLFSEDGDQQTRMVQQPLLTGLASERIDEIRFEDAAGKRLTVRKTDGQWQLTDFDRLPADRQRLEDLLQRLQTLPQGWPVARSAEAAKRFRVSDDQFERHLTLLSAGKVVASLYLGTSPAFRKVHARLADDDRILAIDLNTFDVNANVDDWLNHDLLHLEQHRITTIQLPGLKLQAGEKGLQLADLATTETMRGDELGQLLDAISRLRVLGLAGDKAGKQPPELTMSLTLQSGKTREYRFYPVDKDTDFRLEVSDQPHPFRVAAGLVDRLKAFDRQRLVEEQQAGDPSRP